MLLRLGLSNARPYSMERRSVRGNDVDSSGESGDVLELLLDY